MNFAALADDWQYLLWGTFPEGPPGGALLTLLLCSALNLLAWAVERRSGVGRMQGQG